MNYGHRLRFALRLTTDADHGPGRLIQAAALAEQLGLDLLVIPAGTAGDDLEPSTVSAWIAGATVSLGLTVEAQPTLHPAMLARAVASLDRLTEGRVELALHAGPAAAGSGTAESDAALGEAIAVVRELWNVLDRGLGRFTGGFHRLAGAQKAAPAHDVPIAVDGQGQGQDLLRLVGQQADEWSTGCDAAALARGNCVVDEAARGAGRDPREIRRRITIRGGFG